MSEDLSAIQTVQMDQEMRRETLALEMLNLRNAMYHHECRIATLREKEKDGPLNSDDTAMLIGYTAMQDSNRRYMESLARRMGE
jgi:hypothetical protein